MAFVCVFHFQNCGLYTKLSDKFNFGLCRYNIIWFTWAWIRNLLIIKEPNYTKSRLYKTYLCLKRFKILYWVFDKIHKDIIYLLLSIVVWFRTIYVVGVLVKKICTLPLVLTHRNRIKLHFSHFIFIKVRNSEDKLYLHRTSFLFRLKMKSIYAWLSHLL